MRHSAPMSCVSFYIINHDSWSLWCISDSVLISKHIQHCRLSFIAAIMNKTAGVQLLFWANFIYPVCKYDKIKYFSTYSTKDTNTEMITTFAYHSFICITAAHMLSGLYFQISFKNVIHVLWNDLMLHCIDHRHVYLMFCWATLQGQPPLKKPLFF